jgi:manganese transport protein
VLSQVVLSFALPIPMVALVLFTRRKDIMGEFANTRLTHMVAVVATVIILALNMVLLLQTCGVKVPGLPSN